VTDDQAELARALGDNTSAVDANTNALSADDPITSAANLTDALNANTAALNKVQHNYRNVWVFLILVCVAMAIGGDAIYINHQNAHAQCVRDNTLRQTNLDLWRPLLLEPVPALPPGATEAERLARAKQLERTAAFRKTLETGFATHGC
jgi:hypothetical protein